MSKLQFLLLSVLFVLFVYPSKHFCQLGQFGFRGINSGTRNFAEVSYGIGDLNHKILNTSFNSLALNEVKLGRRTIKPIASYKLLQFSDNYLFSSFVDDNTQSVNTSNKISFEIWRFGLGYRKGFGYSIENFAILPYYQMGLVWNKISLNLPHTNNFLIPDVDRPTLDHYDDNLKFGTTNVGGVDFRINPLFAIGASYETAVIFPYHKVWKQVGSFFIETLTQTGLDFLTEGVLVKQIPAVVPILYFVLKNGLSYYFFTLKQDEMNWPFKTKEPLTLEVLKFSLKITF